jgi:DNA repair photolyase
METNFFELIYALTAQSDIHMTIARGKEHPLIVSLMPVNEKCTDEAKNKIEPLILKGSIELFTNQFFETIQKPLAISQELFSNMQSYIASTEEARKASKMQSEQQDKEKKEKDERKKKYDDKMAKVAELEKAEKIGESIGAMPAAKDFPEQQKDIETKLEELKGKHRQITMF